jgi:hypothetical protein
MARWGVAKGGNGGGRFGPVSFSAYTWVATYSTSTSHPGGAPYVQLFKVIGEYLLSLGKSVVGVFCAALCLDKP